MYVGFSSRKLNLNVKINCGMIVVIQDLLNLNIGFRLIINM